MVEFYEIYIYIFLTERINTRFLFYFIVHLIGILISRAKIRRYGESPSISLVPKCEECIDLFSMEFRDVSKGRILILCSAVKV